MEVVICTGDRDAFQLVDEHVTVLYPVRGVSEVWRMTPEAVEAKYFVPPAQYRDKAALVGETSDNLPGVPGVGDKTAAKWIKEYGGLDGVIANVDKIKGKAGENLRAHLADVMRNYEINRLVVRPRAAAAPRGRALARAGTARRCTRSSTRSSSGCCASGSTSTSTRSSPRPSPASTSTAPSSPAARCPGWLESYAPVGTSIGVAVAGRFGRGTGELTGVALATGDGPAAWFDPAELDEADEAAVAAWLADTKRPKVIHDAKPALLAFRRARLGAARRRPRHRARRLPGPARPAHLRPHRPGAALPAPRAARRRAGVRPAHARRPRRRPSRVEQNLMLRARATLDLADAIDAELSRDGELSARLLAEVELPLVEVLAEMERTGIAADTDYLSELESHFAAEVKAAAQAAYEVVGREFNLGSPKQLQEILFVERGLPKTKRIKTRLHHRRRRAAGPVRADRRPAARAPAAPPRRGQAQVHGGRSAQVGLRRRPHPHHLLPDRGGHRPALVAPTPTCRTSRSAPRRAAASGGRSWSARATSR